MANARGIVEAEVAGRKRRLRLSLEAIDEIEIKTGKPFAVVAVSLTNEATVRFGWVLALFTEMCAAGGTPLSAEERSDLMPDDTEEIIEAVTNTCIAAGAIEVSEAKGPEKKAPRKSRSKRPGASGKK